jgi:TolA-binding protein
MKLRGFAAAAFLAVSPLLCAAREVRVSGIVVDENGAAVEGATITITSPGAPSLQRVSKTDNAGRFSVLLPDPAWDYSVSAEHDGYSPTVSQFRAAGKTELRITLHPPMAPPPPKVDPGVAAYNQGVDLLQAGDRAGAEKKFSEAVALRPDLAAAWRALAQLAYARKDYAAALAAGRKGIEKDSSQTDLYSLLADCAQKTGEAAAAAEYRKKYLDANAENPEVVYNLGVERLNSKDYHGAAIAFAKVVQLKREMADAYFWLAVCEYNLRRYADSRATFQRYLQLAPQGSQAGAAREMLKVMPK